jgi:O-antigen/teichoic acid export membrane protein
MDQAATVSRARDGDPAAARAIVALSIIISAVVSAAAAATTPLWLAALGLGGREALALAVVLWTLPGAVVLTTLALLVTEDRLKVFSVVSILSSAGGQVVGLLLLAFGPNDATTYAWGWVLTQTVSCVIGLIAVRPTVRPLRTRSITRNAFWLGFSLTAGNLASFVLNTGDRVILQRLLGSAAVGQYQIAYVMGSVVLLLLSYIHSAWTPRFAEIRSSEQRLVAAVVSRDALYRLLIPVLLGITLGGPVLLRVFAPPSFHPERLLIVMFTIAVAAFPVASGEATGRLLIAERRGRALGGATVVAAVSNVVLNFLLIPYLGILGSALATLLAFTIQAGVQQLLLGHEWHGPPRRLALRIVLVTVLCLGSTLLPQSAPLNASRFVLAVTCLPWFVVLLRRTRVQSS